MFICVITYGRFTDHQCGQEMKIKGIVHIQMEIFVISYPHVVQSR